MGVKAREILPWSSPDNVRCAGISNKTSDFLADILLLWWKEKKQDLFS